jgi:hypothetical protein
VPVSTSADLICVTFQLGCSWRRSAVAPATCGTAALVPSAVSQDPSFLAVEEATSRPGAVTFGLSRRPYGVGPDEEKEAI